MRQSVYIALIGASSAIRISQTTQGDCTWDKHPATAATKTVGPSGCSAVADVANVNCGSAEEATANSTPNTNKTCNGTYTALAQGDCSWAKHPATAATKTVGPDGCSAVANVANVACGSQDEATANATPNTNKTCNGTYSLAQAQGDCTWDKHPATAATKTVGPSGCSAVANVANVNCGSADEATANSTPNTNKTCNGTYTALAQGDCSWAKHPATAAKKTVGPSGCSAVANVGSVACGSQEEATANSGTNTNKTCNGTYTA